MTQEEPEAPDDPGRDSMRRDRTEKIAAEAVAVAAKALNQAAEEARRLGLKVKIDVYKVAHMSGSNVDQVEIKVSRPIIW